jgi:CBS domain-containing protein
MRCQEIMKQDIQCVTRTESVQEAATRMRDQNIGFLPVCDRQMKVLGTITDRDLAIRILADGRPASTPVEQVMGQDVIACRPEDELSDAETLMARHHKSRIMCIDESGRLVGVISLSDLAHRDAGARVARTLKEVTEREVH